MRIKSLVVLCVIFLSVAAARPALAQDVGQCQGWNTCATMGCALANTTYISSRFVCDEWEGTDGQFRRCCGVIYSRSVTSPAACVRPCGRCSVKVYNAAQTASCPFTGNSCFVNPGGSWGPD